MKRVLLNAAQAGNRSGTGRYITELIREFQKMPLPIELLLLDETGRIQLLPQHDVQDTSPLQRLFLEQLRVPLASLKFGLTHCPAGMGPLLPCGRLILTIHDLAALKHPEWFTPSRAAYYRFALRRGVRRTQHLIADSMATKQDLQEMLGVGEERIDVVPLGVSLHFHPATDAEVQELRARIPLPQSYFLFVGTIEPRKNLPRLVAAYRQIAAEVPEDLVLCGRHGWASDAFLEDCRKGDHAARIHWVNHLLDKHLPALLSSATAFVWPSLHEGFGLPPLEAMACGAPVISSNTTSIPEVVGEAGMLVDPEDTDVIAAAMVRLSGDAALREQLRAAGQVRAMQFTWEKTAALTAAAYIKAMS